MAKHKGTANLLTQNRAYRELANEYSPEVANCLTSKNLLRNGLDVSEKEVAGWAKINQVSCKGHLDIRDEVRRAERQAAAVAGTAVNRAEKNATPERHR